MKKLFALLLLAVFTIPAWADEGMWIPMLLNKNEAEMQKAGMRISAKDIYDINNACLKDAIILFNQGCTGEFVSDQGLFLTNHHCGYSYITSNSTVEHDYLTHGFWAASHEQEIPCRGLTATRLVRMEDVTSQVLQGITKETIEQDRNKIIEINIAKITAAAVAGSHYKAVIKPFYYGNQYFMYINEVFTDVRLVGAPPSNIGKFGGDTDNWMWPRHTGDFSMFRVYVGRDGKPAEFSSSNVPYKPLKHLDISLKGVNEGDFTFVFGYPGHTQRYVTSDAMAMTVEQSDPICIAMRDIRLKHYNNAMNQSPAQRLRYASKVASIANGWKKWQGEIQGIDRLNGIEKKKQFEAQFQAWANDKPEYRNVLGDLAKQYAILRPIKSRMTYFTEGVYASDFMQLAYTLSNLTYSIDAHPNDTAFFNARFRSVSKSLESYYVDFENHSVVDRNIFIETMMAVRRAGMLSYYKPDLTPEQFEVELNRVFDKSLISHPDKMRKTLKNFNLNNPTKDVAKLVNNDPAIQLVVNCFFNLYQCPENQAEEAVSNEIDRLMRVYVQGQMEMQPDVNFFPDANLTLRVAYGHVAGFHPRDGVNYKAYSTLQGIMEKENPDIYDYVVEPRLKELYNNKDYGRYANAQGELPVGFIATNHTTGGNSGSPVLNADGQLIGINFDRCWEGTMSDLLFDPDYCRNICLDIRYCLFVIDKFAGAKHLVDEMTIVQ